MKDIITTMDPLMWVNLLQIVIIMITIILVWRYISRTRSTITDLERTLDAVRHDRDDYKVRLDYIRPNYIETMKCLKTERDQNITLQSDLTAARTRINVLEGQLKAAQDKVTSTDLRERALRAAGRLHKDGQTTASDAALYYRFLSGRA